MNKRIILSILTVFAIALLLIMPNSFAVEEGLTGDDIIPIEDENLKSLLLKTVINISPREMLDANEDGEISVNEIERLVGITFKDVLPSDFSALTYATSLRTLTIDGTIKSLVPLANYPNKERIQTMWIQVLGAGTKEDIDLTGIGGFTNLSNLTIMARNIINMSELAKLQNLTSAILNNNSIKDVTPLASISSLETLDLATNEIIDISALNSCTNLKRLSLTNNKITSIPDLSSLTKLETIQVTNNPLTDASGINSLNNLKTIYLGGTDLNEINLADLSNLETFNINISSNKEKTITLRNLPKLKDIQFANAKVTEVNISNCPSVETITAQGNKIQDISFLKDLSNLKSVDLTSNPFAQDSEVNSKVLADLETRGVNVKKDPYYEMVGPVYELNSEGTGYIVKDFFGMNETEVTVPETYEGLPVVEIGEGAFYRDYADYNLEKIILPETITKIGDRAFFNCQKLKSINIPEGVTEIGREAFEECKLLQNITLPENITIISYGLFWGCTSLNNVIIPESVTDIRGMAFYGCTSITEMVVPDTVVYLGDNTGNTEGYSGGVFSGCTNLRKITLSKNIKKIDHNTFAACNSLEALVIPEGLTEIDTCGIYKCTAMKKLVLPRTFSLLAEEYLFEKGDFNPVIYGYKGSKAEELANEKGFEFVALDGEFVKVNSETDKLEAVKVNEKDVTIIPFETALGVKDYVNVENFPAINNNYEVKILDKNGNEKENTDKIGSRAVIKIEDELGNVFAEITAVVPGDVTGNGYARMYDAFQILKDTIIPGATLDAIDVKIRDYSGDGNVRMYDAFQFLKDSILGN